MECEISRRAFLEGQFLRNSRYQNAFEQAEMILQAALDPSLASKARKGEFVTCLDYFDLL